MLLKRGTLGWFTVGCDRGCLLSVDGWPITMLLLLFFGLLRPVPSLGSVRRACDIPFRERRDAYDESFDLSQCEEKGYCWQEAPRYMHSVPWCYHPVEIEGFPTQSECAAAAHMRRDCAPDGNVNAVSCSEVKRCCWAPGAPGQPWCFYAAGDYSGEEEAADSDAGEEEL